MLSNYKPPSWKGVDIVFLYGHVNGTVFSWLLSQIYLKLCGRELE